MNDEIASVQPTSPLEHFPLVSETQALDQSLERSLSLIAEAFLEGRLQMAVVYDRDETFNWTALKHNAVVREGMMQRGYSEESLPTDDEIIQLGGTDAAYKMRFQNPTDYAVYEELIQINRASAAFNENIPLIDERVPAIVAEAEANGFPAALCLTATPQHLAEVVEAGVHEQVRENVPVVGKPDSVDLTQTTPWKISVLKRIVELTHMPIVIVDDSRGLGQAIAALNDPFIYCITLTGTLTNECTITDRDRGVLTFSDLEHLPQTLQDVYVRAQQAITN